MSDIVLRFPFDLTGSLTSNAVRHPVVLGPGPINRGFAFPTGPFFVDTLRIVAANKPTVPLVRGRLPMIVDSVQTVITPGESIDADGGFVWVYGNELEAVAT